MTENQKTVAIHLLSRQIDAGQTEMFRDIIDDFGDTVDFSNIFDMEKHGEDMMEMRTTGTLTEKDGRVELSYDETELTGMEGSTTTLSFSLDQPQMLTMLRYGAVSTALVFEEGKRHICAYETKYMPFEICVHTRTVYNTITMDGGRADLDYIVEIHGAKAERTIFSLCVTLTEKN